MASQRLNKLPPAKPIFDLNLFRTGILLVGVPILLEVLFVLVLFALLSQVETQANQIERAREMRVATDRVLNHYSRASIALLEYAWDEDRQAKARYEGFVRSAATNLTILRDLSGTDKDLLKALESIESLAERLSTGMERTRQKVERIHGAESIDPFSLMAIHRDRAQVMKVLVALGHELTDYARIFDRSSVSIEEEQMARQRLKQFLIVGIGVQIFVAVWLAALFGGRVLRRISTVKDNTLRLASGRPLNPTLSGTDEIAELDSVFHEMAEALAEAARKERAIIDSAMDVICTIDESGRFISANPAASESWGYSKDELLGLRLSEVVHEEDVARTNELIDKIMTEQTSGIFEARVKHKDGSEVFMLWSVRWSSVEKVLFCVLHDITERKRLERLRQNFLAMVSHDLRTPLNSVKNFLVILDTPIYGELSEKGVTRKASIEQEVERLQKLVDDILDMEKIESGKLELEFNQADLKNVLSRSFEAVRGVAEHKGISIQLPETDLAVTIDEERIVQVLVNLLGNAVKFSPEGSEITVKAQQVDDYAEISVTDRGCGLPPGAEASIFTRFKQFGKGEKSRQGTGLGLAISKEIVSAHDGLIGVESVEGHGSTFWFKIPLSRQTEETVYI